MSLRFAKLLLGVLLSFIVIAVVRGDVIGIDLASDSLKVAIVRPGSPLEIVSNFQSKRKTPVCVAFYNNERLFGSDATALMGRKPELSIAKVARMLGRDADHPAVKELKAQFFPYNIVRNETTSLTSVQVDKEFYTPEELLAMIFQNVKDMTANFGAKGVRDCVITVPASFTQHEREALYTAAEIADLKILSLVEENTAAALHYGIDRTFENPSVVLYYNLGAGTAQISVVSYSSVTVKEGGKNKTVTQFEVLGKAWDDSLGGFNFDVKLADMLAQRFNEVWQKKSSGKGKDLRDFFRPMTRLRIEASKMKEVLSANNEFPIKVERLHADVDLSTKVTRAEFEEACEELFARVTSPIDRALAMANLTLQDVNAVELLGGGVRIPKIKKILDDYFKPSNLVVGQHMNGDEAMALGAAFRAANLSTAFRVRKVGLSDVSSFGISINLDALPSAEAPAGFLGGLFGGGKETTGEANTQSTPWHKHTSLYPAKSSLPAKTKTVAFVYDNDIGCKIEYDHQQENLPAHTSHLIASYNITGVAAFAKETADKGVGAPKVHLSFGLDSSGMVQLLKAEATLEYEEEKQAAGEGEQAGEKPASSNATSAAEDDSSSSTASTTSEAAGSSSESEKKPNKKKHVLRRVLKIATNLESTIPPRWSAQQIQNAKNRLAVMKEADRQRQAKAAALNDLEAYVYKVKNRLMDEEDKLKTVSTEEQRQEVVDLANAAEEWLYDEGRDQAVAVYVAKQNEIKVKAEAIFKRYSEIKARADAVSKASKALSDIRKQMETWAEKMPQITDEEKAALLKLIENVEKWTEEKVSAQEKASPFDTPVFDSSEVAPQLKPVAAMVDKLMRKPKPAPPVLNDEKNTTAASAKNDTASSDGPSDQAGSSSGQKEQSTDESIKVERESTDSSSTGNSDAPRSEEL